MASETEKKVAPPPPKDGAEETPTTHKKKGQVVALGLMVVVVVGLIIQSVANMRSREARHAKAEAAQQAQPAAGSKDEPTGGPAGARLTDFADKQREAAAEADLAASKGARADRQTNLLERLSGESQQQSSEEKSKLTAREVTDDFYLSERKRVLEAARGKLGGVGANDASAKRAPTAATNAQELASVDQKIAELSGAPNQIEQRRQALIARANASGISLPPDIMAKFAGGSPTGAQGAVATPASMAASAMPSTSSQGMPAAQPQLFGELAGNRVVRDPTNPGPRPGEVVLPTGSIISAITDMEMISDYAGNWWGLVQRPVYDVTQEFVLLPAGTKITGKSMRATGVNESIQNRMGSVPLWAIRPDGKRLDFRHAAGMDASGVAALQGSVDRHFLAQFLGIGAYALIGLGPSMNSYGAEPNSSRDEFIKEATGKSRDLGRTFAEKYLNIVPTQTIPPGKPIKIFVEEDIYITPWESANETHYKRR